MAWIDWRWRAAVLCGAQRPLFPTSFVSIACADLITSFVITTEEWCICLGPLVQHCLYIPALFSAFSSLLARSGILASRTLSWSPFPPHPSAVDNAENVIESLPKSIFYIISTRGPQTISKQQVLGWSKISCILFFSMNDLFVILFLCIKIRKCVGVLRRLMKQTVFWGAFRGSLLLTSHRRV